MSLRTMLSGTKFCFNPYISVGLVANKFSLGHGRSSDNSSQEILVLHSPVFVIIETIGERNEYWVKIAISQPKRPSH